MAMTVFARIGRIVRLRIGLPFVRQGDRAREAGEWLDAVYNYRRGLERLPWREDLKVQIGNCLKEFGDYQGAMRAYSSVGDGASLPEARKQAADVARRAETILLPFAIAETPDAVRGVPRPESVPALSPRVLPNRIRLDAVEPRGWLGGLGKTDHVGSGRRGTAYASIKLDQVGAMVIERDGAQEPLLTGVIAIRGRVSTLRTLNDVVVQVGQGDRQVTVHGPLHAVPGYNGLKVYVFNIWIDTTALPPGRHWLGIAAGARIAPAGLFVNVATAGDTAAFASSNSFVLAPPHAPGRLDEAIIAMPCIVRSAQRTLFDAAPRTILAMRVDQLGDVSATLPALARLREIFPAARLIALAQGGTQGVIQASGLVDEVLPIALGYDAMSGRRFLKPEEEHRLRGILRGLDIDLAIDLSPGDESRPLLLLTNATYLVGFNPERFTYLDFGIATRSRDKINQLEKISHAATVSMLVEALAIAAAPARPSVPLPSDTHTGALDAYRLTPKGYVVLHIGARHAINRWPLDHFIALCQRLLVETAFDVVIFADREAEMFAEKLAEALTGMPADTLATRVKVLGLVEPAQFDEIVANAKVMVGNDSGPKHLAAVRGVSTVSIHVDRLNWNEWGQDGMGQILSKPLPCTGCGLNDIAMCGRDAICVSGIGVDEVFGAVSLYLQAD